MMNVRLVFWIIGGLMLLGTVLRIIELNNGLWFDEIATLVEYVRKPLPEIVSHYSRNNHLLYSVLAYATLNVFGEYPWTLRLPAVVFGVACIPALYALGTVVTSRLEALLAAGLLAVSYHHIWFSQNARGYTVEFPRFRGHLILWENGGYDAKNKTSLSTRVSPADSRASSSRAQTR